MATDLKSYFPIGQFELEKDFVKNPLMCGIKLARFKFAAKMLSPEDTVLDIGCGNGLSSYFYSHFSKRVVGVDLYAKLSETTKNLNTPGLSFVQADALSMPFEEGQFTAITSVDVIEHFHQPDGEKIIKRSSELLAENGMMILGTPSKFSEKYRSKQSQHIHFHEYEPDELKALCSKYFKRTILFSMNDEVVHTGFNKLAWFFYVLCFK